MGVSVIQSAQIFGQSAQNPDRREKRKGGAGGNSQQDSVVSGHPVLLVTWPAQSPQAVIVMTMCCGAKCSETLHDEVG